MATRKEEAVARLIWSVNRHMVGGKVLSGELEIVHAAKLLAWADAEERAEPTVVSGKEDPSDPPQFSSSPAADRPFDDRDIPAHTD
ncbi:MAG TPA: hypothetical protein VJG67_00975 [Candidatus Paceibacterota bacterium]